MAAFHRESPGSCPMASVPLLSSGIKIPAGMGREGAAIRIAGEEGPLRRRSCNGAQERNSGVLESRHLKSRDCAWVQIWSWDEPAGPGIVLQSALGEGARYQHCCRLSYDPVSLLLVQFWSNGQRESIRTSAAGSNAPSLARGWHSSVKLSTRRSGTWW